MNDPARSQASFRINVDVYINCHGASSSIGNGAQAGAPVPGFGSMFSAFDFGVATSGLAFQIRICRDPQSTLVASVKPQWGKCKPAFSFRIMRYVQGPTETFLISMEVVLPR